MSPTLDPELYDSQITEREPVGVQRTGASDAANFDVAMRAKRAPKQSVIVTDTLPADIEVDDATPVVVDRVQERAAREYTSFTLTVSPGDPVRVVGEDDTRSRLLLSIDDSRGETTDQQALYLGPLENAGGTGFKLWAANGVFQTEVVTPIYAWLDSAATGPVYLTVWVERN